MTSMTLTTGVSIDTELARSTGRSASRLAAHLGTEHQRCLGAALSTGTRHLALPALTNLDEIVTGLGALDAALAQWATQTELADAGVSVPVRTGALTILLDWLIATNHASMSAAEFRAWSRSNSIFTAALPSHLTAGQTTEAAEFGAAVLAILGNGSLSFDDRAAQLDELYRTMSRYRIGDDADESAAFIDALGPDGVVELHDHAAGADGWLDILGSTAAQLAGAVATMSADEVDDLVAAIPHGVVFTYHALAPWHPEASEVAFTQIWASRDVTSAGGGTPRGLADRLGVDVLPSTRAEFAAGILAEHPELAHRYLTSDRELLMEMVTDVEGEQVGRLITSGLTRWVLDSADPGSSDGDAAFHASRAAFADLVANLDEEMASDSVRDALVDLGGLFLGDLQVIGLPEQTRNPGDDVWLGVTSDDVVGFYAEAFRSERAIGLSAQQLGVWFGHHLHRAIEQYQDADVTTVRDAMVGAAVTTDEVWELFFLALGRRGADDLEQAAFRDTVLTVGASVLTSIGVAAAPVSGGASTALSAGASLGLKRVIAALPEPMIDLAAVAEDNEVGFQRILLRVIVERPEMFDPSWSGDSQPPFLLSEQDWTRLRDDQLWNGLVAPDPDARNDARWELHQILDRNLAIVGMLDNLTRGLADAGLGPVTQ